MKNQLKDDQKWRERLIYAIEHSPKSMRQISIDAGYEISYVFSIVKKGSTPTVDKLANICKAMNVSLYYIMTGTEMSAEAELLLQKYFQLPQKDRQFAIDMIDKISR